MGKADNEIKLDSEDIFQMLEMVQEQQDRDDELRATEQAAGIVVKDGSVSFASDSDGEDLEGFVDALNELVGEIGVEELQGKTIDDYDKSKYGFSQLDEIEKGLKHRVDVSLYDDPVFMFRQMREIRIGLEQGIDVSVYANRYYKDKQMREIRLALMEGYDVSGYARLIYSHLDIQNNHRRAAQERYDKNPKDTDVYYTDRDTGISIYTKEGQMKAYVCVNRKLPDGYSVAKLEALLYIYGVTEGLCLDKLPENLSQMEDGRAYLVAEAIPSVPGTDGYYEYMVKHIGEDKPLVKEDGSIDYQAQRIYSSVREGELIARYHPAVLGTRGTSVMGLKLPTYSGRNLDKMKTEHVLIENNGRDYIAQKNGYVTKHSGILKILDILEFKEDIGYANGNIYFDGNIKITGNILGKASVEATGDIIVNGFAESAVLKAGGDIILTKGVNGNESGLLQAEGKVVAAFFENANIVAGGDVEAGYILNSNVTCKGQLKTKGKKSMICGGKVYAECGIQTRIAGNDAHVRTEIMAGRDKAGIERLQQMIYRRRKIAQSCEKLTQELAGIKDAIEKVLQKFGKVEGRLNPTYLKLMDMMQTTNRKMNDLEKEKKELEEAIDKEEKKRVYIEVSGIAYENTRIVIDGIARVMDAQVTKQKFYNNDGTLVYEVY